MESVIERIEQMSIPEPNTGCWLWLGTVRGLGYGSIKLNGRTLGAHRVSYEAHKGPIPTGLMVMHKCDQPGCVNPEHLVAGTALDNNHDMLWKGRGATRTKHHSVKLTEDQIAFIRANYAPHSRTVGAFALSKRFGVTRETIESVARGRTWSEDKWTKSPEDLSGLGLDRTITAVILAEFEKVGQARARDLKHLGFSTDQIRTTLRYLAQTGRLKNPAYGIYRRAALNGDQP